MSMLGEKEWGEMKRAVLTAAAALGVMGALGAAGCQQVAENSAPYYGDYRIDLWRDYHRNEWSRSRYPGPSLTGGGD